MTPTQTYTVELDNFHGPLDLLLSLIERNELEITDVSVGKVTNDYLTTVAALEKVNDQELSWFLDIASRLIFHKAQALGREQAEIVDDSDLAELTRELARYKYYRQLAQKLAHQLQPPLAVREQRSGQVQLPPRNLTLSALKQSYRNALIMYRQHTQQPVHRVQIKRTDITRTMHTLLARSRKKLALRDVFNESNRHVLTVSLLALLELGKQHKIELTTAKGVTYVKAI